MMACELSSGVSLLTAWLPCPGGGSLGLAGSHEDRSVCSSNYCVRAEPLIVFQVSLMDLFPCL